MAIAVMGLACGTAGGGRLTGAALGDACRAVMLAASALAGLSAMIAALTIAGRTRRGERIR